MPRTADDSNDRSAWEHRITLAVKYQELGGRVNKWREAREWYDNKYPDGVVSVNLVFAIGRALVPQLYFKVPTILVIPRKDGLDKQARILESVDQWLIMHMGMKQQIKLGILDAYTTNIAVYKYGYHSVSSEFPSQPAVGELPEQLMLSFQELFGEEVTEELGKDQEDLRKYSYHDWVKPDSPWMLRTQPEDFLVPWGTKDIYSAPWCAFRVVRPLEDVKKDPVYSNTRNLKPNVTLNTPAKSRVKSPTESQAVDTKIDMVEGFEIWDKRDGKVRFLVEGYDKWLRNDEHGLEIDGLPVEVLQFNPTGWSFWGESDAQQISRQVIEYNETRTLEIMHKRAAVTKLAIWGDAIDDPELAKLMKGELIAVKFNQPPSQAVLPLTMNMSRDIFNVGEIIRDDIREILGFSRNQAGEFEASRRTAMEASIVQQAIQIRSDERRDQVADLVAASFQRKIHPMVFVFWNTERTIQVTALQGWTSYTGPQVRGDYDVIAVPDTVLPLTRAQRQQAAMQALQAFKGDPMIDQSRLYEWVLSQFEGIYPRDLLVSPEKRRQIEMMMQLMQRMRAAGQQPGQGGNGGTTRPGVQNVQR